MDRYTLLDKLPPYTDTWVTVKDDQQVKDIVKEVLRAHKEFAPYYDSIAIGFEGDSVEDTCRNIYRFLKKEVVYREEGVDDQTTALPTGILTRGYGDCKHYASFAGGVLSALNRMGAKIDWGYRFASYKLFERTPYHVFIVVNDSGQEIWIDPTPGAAGRVPVWQYDHKIKDMALRRNIGGVEEGGVDMFAPDLAEALQDVDTSIDISEQAYNAIATLLNYGVLNDAGEVDMTRLNSLSESLPLEEKENLIAQYNAYLNVASVGNIFKDLWRGVKVVSLSVPRNAYLGLVALNVFGMATKLQKAFLFPDAKAKILDKWYKLGGKESGITSAINSGAKKNPILKISGASVGVAAAAAPAWLAVAAGIIAAIMPLVASLLKEKNADMDFGGLDANGLPVGYNASGGGGGIENFVRNNPIPVFGGLALLAWWWFDD